MTDINTRLETMLDPVVASLDCELWGLEYHPQKKRGLLRLYIEKTGGVSIDDCERVSRQVSSVLDVENPIASEYVLEVSSPGMDRPLFKLPQFSSCVGQRLQVRLRIAFEGRRNFTGLLKGLENEDEVVIEADGEEFLLPYELIDRARVIPNI